MCEIFGFSGKMYEFENSINNDGNSKNVNRMIDIQKYMNEDVSLDKKKLKMLIKNIKLTYFDIDTIFNLMTNSEINVILNFIDMTNIMLEVEEYDESISNIIKFFLNKKNIFYMKYLKENMIINKRLKNILCKVFDECENWHYETYVTNSDTCFMFFIENLLHFLKLTCNYDSKKIRKRFFNYQWKIVNKLL